MSDKHSTQSNSRSILKNMAVLATGTGIAKVIGVISIPIITRIYSPEHLGALSVFIAIAAMLIPFGSLRYVVALPLPRHDALALNLAVASFGFLVIVSLLSIILLAFTAEPIMNLLSMPILITYWWLLPIAIFGAGLYEILNSWATREKAFKLIAKANVWQTILGEGTKIGLGLLGFKPLGLLAGHVVKQSAGIYKLSQILLNKLKIHKAKITKQRIIFLIKRYRDYPKYRLPSQFLLVFATQSPLLFSAWLYGAEVTGQLGLALMALALPIALFGNTTGQAYYAEIAKLGRKQPEKILQITKNITIKLFIVSIPPFLILLFFGPWLFQFVFGKEWEQAGLFASILAIYLMIQFASSPIVKVLDVFEKQSMFLQINIVRTIGIVIIFITAYFLNLTVVETLYAYTFALSAHYLFTIYSIYNVIKSAKVLV